MIEVLAIIACSILAGLSIFQLALIAGAPLGKFAWGGSHAVLPSKLRFGSFVSIVLYIVFALIMLEVAGVVRISSNQYIPNVGIWILTAYFFIGIFMNAVSRSKSERAVMTPIATTLAVLCLLIAIH
jgi:hypothetical protein